MTSSTCAARARDPMPVNVPQAATENSAHRNNLCDTPGCQIHGCRSDNFARAISLRRSDSPLYRCSERGEEILMTAAMVALISAFGLVLAVELPDKTLVATLVLTTRFRGWPVFAGVCAAFAVQCVIAVAFGSVLTLLPEVVLSLVVAAMFGLGAFMLLREGFSEADEAGEDASRSGPSALSFTRSAMTSFGVLFAAEWGDASQLATASLTARIGNPFAVGVGALSALVVV